MVTSRGACSSPGGRHSGEREARRRRVRDRRRRDSALPASVVQSLPQNAADNPSLDDPRHPGRVLFRTAFPISFLALSLPRQRPSSKERPRAAASAPARLERPSRFVHARPRAPAMTCASAKTPRKPRKRSWPPDRAAGASRRGARHYVLSRSCSGSICISTFVVDFDGRARRPICASMRSAGISILKRERFAKVALL